MLHLWFWSMWWLVFPVMIMAFGLLRMWFCWLAYRDQAELFRICAAQGRDPAETARLVALAGPAFPQGWRTRRRMRRWAESQWGPGAPYTPTPTAPRAN